MSAPNPTGMPYVGPERPVRAHEMREAATRQLAALATMIAMEAPARFSKVGYTCTVNRATVTMIRNVLDAMGVDWKTKHKQLRSKTK